MQKYSEDPQKDSIIHDLLAVCVVISDLVQNSIVTTLQSSNSFGDIQLELDIQADNLIEKTLKDNPHVGGFASQERPKYIGVGEGDYMVTFDPLDGSSIIDTNFSVGSIFCLWKKGTDGLLGYKGKDAVNGLVVTYGPRTTCVFYNDIIKAVQELTLIKGSWVTSLTPIIIEENAKIFSPGNLRAASQRKDYSDVINMWTSRGLTLRYTGGLVPDSHQIFIKGNGIFTSIASSKHAAKLRVLYEIIPICFLIEKAGGRTIGRGLSSVLEVEITGYDQRMEFIMGSSKEVELIKHLLQ